jgi:arsenate reductase
MENIVIWHNPRCSKSRNALQFLQDKEYDITVVNYLQDTPNEEDIKEVLQMLGFGARALMRTKEDIYKELNLKDESNEEVLIQSMVKYPKLIERPVIIKNGTAVIARPLENIEKIL